MKEPLEIKLRTEETFGFAREEVSSVNRLWSLSVSYSLEERNINGGSSQCEELVNVLGTVGDKENPYGASSAQLDLCFRVKERDYNSIEDLSVSNMRWFEGVELIRKQAIALLRKELPDYVVRLLPEE